MSPRRASYRLPALVPVLLLPLLGSVLLLLLLGPAVPSAAQTAVTDAALEGWNALWTNDYRRAEHYFSAALTADRDDQRSRRGLLLAALALGKDDVVLRELDAYGDRAPTGPFDFFIPEVVNQFSGMDSRDFHRVLSRFSDRLASAKDLPPVDRRMYVGLASRHAYLSGDAGSVERLGKGLNRLDRWCVLGPFDNTSGSGHRVDHVDPKYVLAAPYEGKFGQTVKWFSPRRIALDRSIEPIQYFHQDVNTTAYVRTVAEMERADTYLVSVSYEGDMEFRVNDTVVHEGTRYTSGIEVLHWLVDLPAGGNLLAFKVSNRDEASSIACAISRPDGSAARGVTLDPARQLSVPPGGDLNVRPVRASFLDSVSAGARERPDDLEAQFWNLQRVQRYAEPDSTVALCEALSGRFPNCALMGLAVAAAYGAAGEDDKLRRHMDESAELAPDLAPAVLHRAARDAERKRCEVARAAAEGVLQRAPHCRQALELRLGCLMEEQLLEELKSAAEKVVELLPDEPIGYSFLSMHAASRGLSTERKRLAKKMVDRMPTQSAILARYIESAEEDDYKAMEEEIRKFMKLAPDSPILMERFVGTLLARDRRDKAYDEILEGLRSFPQSVALLYYRALFAESGYDFDQAAVPSLFPDGKRTLTDEELDLMWPDGHAPTRVISLTDQDAVERWFRSHCNGVAAEILEEALAIEPGNFQLRDKIRALRGKSSYRTFMPDPDEDAILATRVPGDRFAGEDAVVLTERKRRLAYDRHASIVDYCIAVQMLNEEGIRRWESYYVSLNPYASDIVYLESKTVKQDGTESEAETGLAHVLFTNVEPGDVLYLHYQMTTHVSGALSGNFWDSHLFSFRDPCLESIYTLVAPSSRHVFFELHNGSAHADSLTETTETLDEEFVRREWRFSAPPKVGNEPGAAPARSFLPWLDVTTIRDWKTLATWYSDLASGQAEITRRVRQKADELVEGADGDDEKLRNILNFVSDDITYQSIPFFQSAHVPREADEVLRDRLGDCKDKCTLMIALLEASGIEDCSLALVAVGSDERVTFLPSPRFDHVVICRTLPDGERRWYDPTVRFPDPDQVPGHIAGAPALVAREGEVGLRKIPEPGICERPRSVESKVRLSSDGSVSVERVSTYSRIDDTSPRRAHLKAVSEKDREDELLAALAVSCPGVELSKLEVFAAERPGEPLIYDYAFEASNVFAATGDILSGALPPDSHLTDAFGAIVAKKERASPVDLRALGMCERARTVLEYPDDLDIVATPDPREFGFGDCRYSTRYEAKGNTLVIERETTIAGRRVEVADYAEFKGFLENILQDMRTPLLFR
ncbi:MAG: DUF3857 domain-containing protein, partial [Candidatus Eisenbacteria bacterium]